MLFLVVAAASVILSNAIRLATYDEIDYLAAADLSVSDTWRSSNTLSFKEFLDEGLRKIEKQNKSALGLVSENRDGFLLRHFHGVLPSYILSVLINICPDFDSARIYFTALVFLLFSVSFLLFIGKISRYDKGDDFVALVLAAFVFSPGTIESFSLLNFHTILAVLMIGYLHFLEKLVRAPTTESSVWLGFFSALMVLTLETSLFILVLGFAFYIIAKPKDYYGRNPWPLIVLVAIITILVLHPGWFESLDTVKAVLMYAYRLFFKGGAEYASGGKLHLLIWSILSFWPFLIIFIILTSYAFILRFRKLGSRKVVFSDGYWSSAFIGVCYLILIIPFTLNVTYLLPGILALALAAANVFCVKDTSSVRVFVSILSVSYGIFLLMVSAPLIAERRLGLEVSQQKWVSEIKPLSSICAGSGLNSGLLLSSDANIFNLYLGLDCARLLILDHDGRSLVVRDQRSYISLREFLASGRDAYFVDLIRSQRADLRSRLLPFVQEEVSAGQHIRLLRLKN